MVRETIRNGVLLSIGALGFMLPALFLYFEYQASSGWWPNWIMYVWPFSILLMGLGGGERDLVSYFLIGFCMVLNGLLYAYVASVLYRLALKIGSKGRGSVKIEKN